MVTRLEQVNALHDAREELGAAWDELTTAVARGLEGWDDPASRVSDARIRVRAATGRANAVLEQALLHGALLEPQSEGGK